MTGRNQPMIGLVGAGSMASAIARGWINGDSTMAARIVLTDRGSGRAAALAAELGCTCVSSNRELAAAVDIIVMCVKPLDVETVLREISGHVRAGAVVASVAAGVQIATIANLLEGDVAVLRLMPNVPVRVCAGTSVWAANKPTDSAVLRAVEAFGALGTMVHLAEQLFDAATAVSGSGPAFFGLVVEAFEDAAIVAGLSAGVGRVLALSTMTGTARMLEAEDLSCAALRRMVTSPGGTAAAGVAHLERSSVRGSIIDAVVAARDRSRQLG